MKESQARLDIRVYPGAGKNEIKGFKDGVLDVRITAHPEKGKANEALIKYLSDILGIAKNSIEIRRGTASRRKSLVISGLDEKTVMDRLSGLKK
jgi:uncharacterized protein